MISYKEKVVCFIDILGFREMVNVEYADHPEKIYKILSQISMSIMEWSKTAITQGLDLQITQFSDSIVFSFVPTKHYFMNFSFFKELAIQMINQEVIFRGGITYGKIFHNTEFVFGPGMIQAYHLESKLAIVPRIIIDDLAMNLKDEVGKSIKDYTGQFVFKMEDTGQAFIDYIFDVFPYTMDQAVFYSKLRQIISKGLQNADPKVVAKYEWMKVEYNQAKSKFPGLVLL
jgi:hypothetical protein